MKTSRIAFAATMAMTFLLSHSGFAAENPVAVERD